MSTSETPADSEFDSVEALQNEIHRLESLLAEKLGSRNNSALKREIIVPLLMEPDPDSFTTEQTNEIGKHVREHFGPATSVKVKALIGMPAFQHRVQPWLLDCFGPTIAGDKEERSNRFLEEAIELYQAADGTRADAHSLVDYVFNRPTGERPQEVGGVMLTLAAFCIAHKLNMHQCGEIELARVWTKLPQIRAKQAAKPKNSPLPMHVEVGVAP